MERIVSCFHLLTNRFLPNPAQREVWGELKKVLQVKGKSSKRWLWNAFTGNNNTGKWNGIYIWGSVGSGKTAIMDHFYSHLTPKTAVRVHFGQFLQDIHRNSCRATPTLLAGQYENKRVLCLDEFQVRNIADAMTLKKVLLECKAQNTFIVTTSNTPPDQLYLNGIQRENFLPCIEYIKRHFQVVCLNAEVDLRLKNVEKAKENFARHALIGENSLDFLSFFQKPLWTMEYLKLVTSAEQKHTIHIANFIPFAHIHDKNIVERFITFIDCAYDAKHKVKIDSIYSFEDCFPLPDKTSELSQEQKRCISRCIEMMQ